MDITWMGHSCFRFRSDELTVITDPYPESIGLEFPEQKPILATVSHPHINHSCEDKLGNSPRVLKGPGEYELAGIYITGIMTPRGEDDPPDKRNTAYLFEIENLRVCHLGDVSSKLLPKQVQEISPLDILLAPVGGVCTIGVAGIAEMIRALSPRVVIPMHHRVPGLQVELNPVDDFLREMGIRDAVPQPRLNISATSLPAELRVLLLDPRGVPPPPRPPAAPAAPPFRGAPPPVSF